MKSAKDIMNQMLKDDKRIQVFELTEDDMEDCGEYINDLNKVYKDSGFNFLIDEKTGAIRFSDSKERPAATSHDERIGSIKRNDSKGKIIANFFIVPQYHIIIDHFNKKEKLIYIEVYSLEYEEYTSLILSNEELNSSKWISDYLDPKFYVLADDYKRFKDVISVTMLYDEVDSIEISNYTGWNRDEVWHYELPSCRSKCSDNAYLNNQKYIKDFYKESLEFLNAASEQVTVKLFSYCILSTINGILRSASLEPKFALVLTGSKETFVMQLAELFVNNFIPGKGLNKLCNYDDKECYSIMDSVLYSSDSVDNTLRKLNIIKDQAVIIDGIIKPGKKNIKDLYEDILINYYWDTNRKKIKKDVKRHINALPVFVVPEPIEGAAFSCITIEKESVNQDILLQLRRKDYILSEMAYRFVEWIEECLLDEEKVLKAIYKNYDLNRRFLFYNDLKNTERDASINAWYLLAFNLYIEFGYVNNYITKKQFLNYLEMGFKAITGQTVTDLKGYNSINNEILNIELKQKKDMNFIVNVIYNIYKNANSKLRVNKGDLTKNQIGWIIEMEELFTLEGKQQNVNVKLLCFEKNSFYDIFNSYIKELQIPEYELTEIEFRKYKKLFEDKHLIKYNDRGFYLKNETISKKNTSGGRYIAFRIENVKRYIETTGKSGN